VSINNHANIFPTDELTPDATRFFVPEVRSPALTFVEITTNHPATTARLLTLTPRELEVCVLHFAEGRSQTQVAAWLGVTVRAIQKSIRRAVIKVPELKPLQVSQRQRHAKPRVVHLSQLSMRDRSSRLFNADEL
jgi:predicted DNA-binding protein (UPF0251 family)